MVAAAGIGFAVLAGRRRSNEAASECAAPRAGTDVRVPSTFRRIRSGVPGAYRPANHQASSVAESSRDASGFHRADIRRSGRSGHRQCWRWRERRRTLQPIGSETHACTSASTSATRARRGQTDLAYLASSASSLRGSIHQFAKPPPLQIATGANQNPAIAPRCKHSMAPTTCACFRFAALQS